MQIFLTDIDGKRSGARLDAMQRVISPTEKTNRLTLFNLPPPLPPQTRMFIHLEEPII